MGAISHPFDTLNRVTVMLRSVCLEHKTWRAQLVGEELVGRRLRRSVILRENEGIIEGDRGRTGSSHAYNIHVFFIIGRRGELSSGLYFSCGIVRLIYVASLDITEVYSKQGQTSLP